MIIVMVAAVLVFTSGGKISPPKVEKYFVCPDGSQHGPGMPSEGTQEWCRENGFIAEETENKIDWQTYSNQSVGLSLKYPNGWFVVADESQILFSPTEKVEKKDYGGYVPEYISLKIVSKDDLNLKTVEDWVSYYDLVDDQEILSYYFDIDGTQEKGVTMITENVMNSSREVESILPLQDALVFFRASGQANIELLGFIVSTIKINN